MRVITKNYPRNTEFITLYPISDLHLGARECREQEFDDYIKQIEADDTAAIILAGDMLNNGIKSSVTDVYCEKYTPHEQKKLLVKKLKPVKKKIIAGVFGNHEYRTIKETSIDVMEDVFDELGIPEAYAGDAAFLKISLGKKYNGKPATYMIYVSHGSGGGSMLGSGVSKQDGYQLAIEGVDISITGHTHKPSKNHSARLVFDPQNNKVTERNTLIFVCTAWLNYGGYPVTKQLRPTAFHPDTIRLDGKVKSWK